MATISENLQTLNNIKQDIKTAIEGKGQDLTNVPFTQYAEKINAIKSGGESSIDNFWDLYQNEGKRTDYRNAFGNRYWTNETFKPKYDITCYSNSYNIFDNSGIEGSLPEILNGLGIKLEFKNISYQSGGFVDTWFSEIEYNLISGSPTLASVFKSSKKLQTLTLKTINKGIKFSTTFHELPLLENLILVGEIGQNGFDVSQSPLLSKTSIKNIIDCLSTDTTGLTVTLSLAAVNKAFETSGGANDGESSVEWNNLKDTKTNWTINLA